MRNWYLTDTVKTVSKQRFVYIAEKLYAVYDGILNKKNIKLSPSENFLGEIFRTLSKNIKKKEISKWSSC